MTNATITISIAGLIVALVLIGCGPSVQNPDGRSLPTVGSRAVVASPGDTFAWLYPDTQALDEALRAGALSGPETMSLSQSGKLGEVTQQKISEKERIMATISAPITTSEKTKPLSRSN